MRRGSCQTSRYAGRTESMENIILTRRSYSHSKLDSNSTNRLSFTQILCQKRTHPKELSEEGRGCLYLPSEDVDAVVLRRRINRMVDVILVLWQFVVRCLGN